MEPRPPTPPGGEPADPAPRSRSRVLICDHRGQGLARHLAPLEGLGFRLAVSRRPAETRELVGSHRPDVVVLDPLATGGQVELEELERLADRLGPRALLLVHEPASPPPLASLRVLAGEVWDLIRRDAPLEEYAMRIERLHGQRRQLDDYIQTRYRASHDDLTDLLRRDPFKARLLEHFSAAQRHRFELALVLIDLDEFGQVNKVHDHTVGDLVITCVAEELRKALRTEDAAGRLGGDEFGVVLPYTSKVEAAHVARRLRQAVRRVSGRVSTPERELEVRASIGFETFDGRDLDTVATLRRHAEVALRAAKRAGGDRAVYYRLLDPPDGRAGATS